MTKHTQQAIIRMLEKMEAENNRGELYELLKIILSEAITPKKVLPVIS